MKDKKTGLIQTLIGAIILVIGIVLCVNTYIVKGNKAYAFSLLVTILGIVILIAGIPSRIQGSKDGLHRVCGRPPVRDQSPSGRIINAGDGGFLHLQFRNDAVPGTPYFRSMRRQGRRCG